MGLPDADDMDMDAVERLAGDTQDVPVVVLTGLADEEKAIEALRHGAQDYLFKSHMNGEWLRSSMRNAVERTLPDTLKRFKGEAERRATS